MTAFIVRRLFIAIPTLFIIIALSFLLMHGAPGGPFDTDSNLDPEILENLKRAYNLDKPLPQQFILYIGNILTGDLGPSIIYKDFTVTELLAQGLPVSLNLGLKAISLALFLGGIFGIIAALNQNGKLDYLIMSLSMSGIAIPNFVVAPILTLFFGIYLKVLPVAGWGDLKHQILPAIALATPQIAIIARLMRGSMIEVLRSNYIRTARAKGIDRRRIVLRHALPAAILPVISYLGPAIAGVITGSVIIEQIFELPGVGRYFIEGAINRDYPLVLGIVIFFAAAVIIMNLIVDILYGVFDPKVKHA